MLFIYATGQPGGLNFAVAERRESIPASAILFAICHAGRTTESLDEVLFNAMTDEEYYELRFLVSEAERQEGQFESSRRRMIELPVERFLSWLRGGSGNTGITFPREQTWP